MKAGDLRHRVEIGRYVIAQDPNGDPVTSWQTVATVWASVEALGGSLYFQAQQTAEKSDHRVTIRYRSDVEPGMEIHVGARKLRITAVLDRDGLHEWLECLAEEVRPA